MVRRSLLKSIFHSRLLVWMFSAGTRSLYGYIWRTSREGQIRTILLVAIITPLSMVPLELQRRIVDHAVKNGSMTVILTLVAIYLAVILVQGGLKYILNLTKGRVLEVTTRDLRLRIVAHSEHAGMQPDPFPVDGGTTVSMLAAESEDVGGFASDSISTPLLQSGTILWIIGYLIWVEPLIALLGIVVYAPQALLVPYIQKSINRLARKKTSLVRKLGRTTLNEATPDKAEHAKRQALIRILIQQIFRVRLHIYRRKYFLTFLGNVLDALGPIIVLGVGGYAVIKGQTEVATIVVFISGFQRISDPWDQLVTFYRTVSNARVSYLLIAEALGGTDGQSIRK